MLNMSSTIFVVSDGTIRETTPRDLEHIYADLTTSPQGVMPRVHRRGNELWTWGTGGNYPRKISTHNSNDYASDALNEYRINQLYACEDIEWFKTLEEAREFIVTCLKADE